MIETHGIPQLVTAAVVAIGAIVAVSARLPRVAILGLLVVLLGGPSVTSAVPDPLGAAPRLIGAVLGAYLLWIAVRDAPAGTFRGSGMGWAGTTALGCTAFGAGVAIAAVLVGEGGTGRAAIDAGAADTVTGGDRAAVVGGLAAAVTLAVLAAAPTLLSRDVLRTGLGLLLLLAAVDLGREALDAVSGLPGDAAAGRGVELSFAVATAATSAVVAWLIRRILDAGGDLGLETRPARRPPATEGRKGRP
ncbi:MAG TPA: hypothetical protein VFK54_04250 [Candidatus Limnocylindrales bacterium]|nr:hypothetical protein [Candidatus Limnocylindrales bacterium]